MNRLILLIPKFDQQTNTHLIEWLSAMTELQLIADVVIQEVLWKQGVSGAPRDWLAMVEAIALAWTNANGFVIWAPERSLLELSGTLSVLYKKEGKPIVLFASPRPGAVTRRQFDQLGIAATVLNACYAAQSDLGEVLVLSGSSLFRAPDCDWVGQTIESVSKPLATLDFSLNIHLPYFARKRSALPTPVSYAFSPSMHASQWFPSMVGQPQLPKETSVVFVTADAAYWKDESLQSYRYELLKQGLPVIWHSRHAFDLPECSDQELCLSVEKPWWGALLTRVSFGSFKSKKKAFDFISDRAQPTV